jgi:hypothetical protein
VALVRRLFLENQRTATLKELDFGDLKYSDRNTKSPRFGERDISADWRGDVLASGEAMNFL